MHKMNRTHTHQRVRSKAANFCFRRQITVKYFFANFLVYFREDNSLNMFFLFFVSRQLSSISSPVESVVYICVS